MARPQIASKSRSRCMSFALMPSSSLSTCVTICCVRPCACLGCVDDHHHELIVDGAPHRCVRRALDQPRVSRPEWPTAAARSPAALPRCPLRQVTSDHHERLPDAADSTPARAQSALLTSMPHDCLLQIGTPLFDLISMPRSCLLQSGTPPADLMRHSTMAAMQKVALSVARSSRPDGRQRRSHLTAALHAGTCLAAGTAPPPRCPRCSEWAPRARAPSSWRRARHPASALRSRSRSPAIREV